MDPVLMRPKRQRGSRWCNGALNQHFRPVRRAIGATVDVAWCGWIYPIAYPAALAGMWRSHTSADPRIGWSIYLNTDGTLRLYWSTGGNGAGATKTADSTAVVPLGEWSFLVVNLDRSAQGQVFLNDMVTAAIDADISGEVAVDWSTGNAAWYVMASGTTNTINGRISRFGLSIGNLLTADDREALLNSGRGIRFAELTGDQATKFTDQDWFDCKERTGSLANQSTPASPAPGYATNTATSAILSWRDPARNVALLATMAGWQWLLTFGS